jgi:hypothetical protein
LPSPLSVAAQVHNGAGHSQHQGPQLAAALHSEQGLRPGQSNPALLVSANIGSVILNSGVFACRGVVAALGLAFILKMILVWVLWRGFRKESHHSDRVEKVSDQPTCLLAAAPSHCVLLQLLTDAERARSAVEELDKIKSEFTAFLCHELRK